MALRHRLKILMEQQRIGNKELSLKSGVPLRTINNILSGVTDNPTLDTIRSLSKALNCTLDDFDDEQQEASETDDLTEYLDELRYRPEMRMLFSVSKKASKEDVEKAVKIIEMLKGDRNDD